MEIPSTFAPILACGNAKLVDESQKTKSKSGNIETAIPDARPCNPQINNLGNAASDIRKFLQ